MSGLARAQSSLSYELTTETWYEAASAVSTQGWHLFDKLDTRPNSKVERVSTELLANGEWKSTRRHIFDSRLESWREYVPAVSDISQNGFQVHNAAGKIILSEPADSSFAVAYQALKSGYQSRGLYTAPILTMPDSARIGYLQANGWTTGVSGGVFTMSKTDKLAILEPQKLTVRHRSFEKDILIRETEEVYQQLPGGQIVPLSRISRRTERLSQGQCVTFVKKETYRDFAYKQSIQPRAIFSPAISFSLSPNPARDALHIRVSAPEIFDFYRVADVHGRILVAGDFALSGTQVLDIGQVPAGMYHLILSGKGVTQAGSFVKN